jgi:hypothetical protein
MRLYDPPPENTYGFRKCCEAIKAMVPVESLARRYTELRPLGGRAWFDGRCPLPDHDDHDPSFYIYPPGRWHCYSCDRGGDVIDLEYFCGGHAGLWVAMMALKEDFGVELPTRPQGWHRWQKTKCEIRNTAEEARKAVRRERLFKLLVLTGPEFEIEDPEERRAAIEQAWKVWESSMRRIGL